MEGVTCVAVALEKSSDGDIFIVVMLTDVASIVELEPDEETATAAAAAAAATLIAFSLFSFFPADLPGATPLGVNAPGAITSLMTLELVSGAHVGPGRA